MHDNETDYDSIGDEPPGLRMTRTGLRRATLTATRVALGVVFVWFGALKVTGTSPVSALVAGTIPWLDPTWLVPSLGGVEVALGLALIVARGLPVVACLVAAHLTGTLAVFAMQPNLAFAHQNPLMLTTTGEFVLKNLVLICAALVIAAHSPARSGRRAAYELAA